jgi:hypothetical protein
MILNFLFPGPDSLLLRFILAFQEMSIAIQVHVLPLHQHQRLSLNRHTHFTPLVLVSTDGHHSHTSLDNHFIGVFTFVLKQK